MKHLLRESLIEVALARVGVSAVIKHFCPYLIEGILHSNDAIASAAADSLCTVASKAGLSPTASSIVRPLLKLISRPSPNMAPSVRMRSMVREHHMCAFFSH